MKQFKHPYSVSVLTNNTEYCYTDLSRSEAVKTAKRESKKAFNVAVYVLTYQRDVRMFLNADLELSKYAKNWIR